MAENMNQNHTPSEEPLVQVRNLKKYFPVGKKHLLHAVDDVSFDIYPGETVGLVGESGCGKSTVGTVVMRLQDQTDGQVLIGGKNIFDIKDKDEDLAMRKRMQIVFQDPYSSINPRKRVREILAEGYKIHHLAERGRLEENLFKLCDAAGISHDLLLQFPHELDGGQRQVVGIARALSLDPEFIVCDEPVSSLDVSVQAKIINLLMRLQRERNLSYLFISHDLSVVKHISSRIVVMYLGRIVEIAEKHELFRNTLHPYSIALLSAIPKADVDHKVQRILLKGDVPSPIDPASCCRFASRCWMSRPECFEHEPELRDTGGGHYVACHYADRSRELMHEAELSTIEDF